MTKTEVLETLILLSNIQTWAFSIDKRMPDHLHEALSKLIDMMRKEVLDEKWVIK